MEKLTKEILNKIRKKAEAKAETKAKAKAKGSIFDKIEELEEKNTQLIEAYQKYDDPKEYLEEEIYSLVGALDRLERKKSKKESKLVDKLCRKLCRRIDEYHNLGAELIA